MERTAPNPTTAPHTSDLCRVLGSAGATMRPIDASQLPEPYRELLAHDRDMTPTLEAFCGERLHLNLLHREVIGDVMLRRVLLVTDGGINGMRTSAFAVRTPLSSSRIARAASVPRSR